MNPFLAARPWALSIIALVTAGGAGPAVFAAETPPVVAQLDVRAPVTVKDDGDVFVLANGIVTARINKHNGDLESLIYQGIDTMGHDQGRAGYWEQDPSRAALVGGLTQSITIDPSANGGARAEVSIKGVTQGDAAAGLTPGSPGGRPGGMVNCDLEIRYDLGRGESGIYVYAIFSHPAAYGPLSVPESRYITKLNQAFDWISVDRDRNMLECAPRDWGTGVVVHAKEQRILTQGVYRNSVEHKYSYTAVQYRTPAFGWSSTGRHIGIWFINPSIEYLSGGATKQELECHYGDTANPDPIILDYWRGTHYNGGASCNVPAGEKWDKVIGPIFIYVNSLARYATPSPADLATLAATAGNPTVPPAWTANATALWRDALAQAKKEKAGWPYAWVNGVDYPHRDQRGTVIGQLVLVDPQAATTLLPGLTVGLAYPDEGADPGAPIVFTAASKPPPRFEGFGGRQRNGPPTPEERAAFAARLERFRREFHPPPLDWEHDAKHYQFWTDGSEDGRFTITNVRPGTYELHAFADGVLGVYAKADITVRAGETVNLGRLEWKPVRYGRQVWEIGYPDRTGDKFFKGDGADYWLWGWCLRYPLLFPHDITYTIGKSDYRRDWFFEQVPHGESLAWLNPVAKDPANQRFGWVKAESLAEYPQTDQSGPWRIYGHGRATTWTIKFPMTGSPHGLAALRVALAGANAYELGVAVNGDRVGAIYPKRTDAIRYNTNKSVWYQYVLEFDAARLHQGENEMQLTVPAGDVTAGVVYDYLRLELNEHATPAGSPASPP